MAFHRRYVLCLLVTVFVASMTGCNDGKTSAGGGGSQGGQQIGGGVHATQMAGICDLPAAGNCTSANTCSAASCNVGLAINTSGGVDMTLNGQALSAPQYLVCTAQGAAITWKATPPPPPNQHSSFLLDFGNTAPFTNNAYLTYATGSDTQPANESVASGSGCYKYNVKVCPIPATAGPTALGCGEIDPTVIVGSGGTMVKK